VSSKAMEVRDAAGSYVLQAEQEVPPGYKRTEVGVIPVDWKTIELEKVSDFITKGSTPTTYGFKWETEGVLFLRSECVSESGLDLEQSMFISRDAHALLRRSEVHDGDILVTITGNVGRVVYLSGIGAANINQHIARIRVTSPSADTKYVFHYLSQESVRRYFSKITTGQAYPQISLEQVRETEIPIPPLDEQHAIATALSDVDALITALDKLIAKKRAIKTAAMQQLLTGKTRLPGFSGEWETKRFDEVLIRLNGKNYQIQTSQYGDIGKYPVIDQGKGAIIGYCDREDKRFRCPDDGLIVFGDHTCITKFVDFDFVVGADGTQLLQAKKGYSTKFLAYQLQHEGIEPTGYNRHFKFLKERVFYVPAIEEQSAIAQVLSDMDAEIAALEARRDKTRAIKQSMMQQLLTGRVRLVKPGSKEAA